MNQLAIQTRGLTKQFGTRKALDNVSFDLPEGSFLSVFGPNGAGKTTLLRVVSTLARPTEGSARLLGLDLKEDADAIRAQIGLIGHNSMLYPDLTAEENLEFYAELYGVANPRKRVMEMLEAVELKGRRFDLVRTYSRGMTQRLAIARALVHNPQLVLLDEPYSGLDPHAMDVFDQLIFQHREGRTFVMVSHDLAKGYSMCTHALVMARGKVVAFDNKEALGFQQLENVYHEAIGGGVM